MSECFNGEIACILNIVFNVCGFYFKLYDLGKHMLHCVKTYAVYKLYLSRFVAADEPVSHSSKFLFFPF